MYKLSVLPERMLISSKKIMKLYNTSYKELNRLTREGSLMAVKKGNRRYYKIDEIEKKFGGKKTQLNINQKIAYRIS